MHGSFICFSLAGGGKKTFIKDKQSQIIRSSEHILELLDNEKF